jgi:hypothetical protein
MMFVQMFEPLGRKVLGNNLFWDTFKLISPVVVAAIQATAMAWLLRRRR